MCSNMKITTLTILRCMVITTQPMNYVWWQVPPDYDHSQYSLIVFPLFYLYPEPRKLSLAFLFTPPIASSPSSFSLLSLITPFFAQFATKRK